MAHEPPWVTLARAGELLACEDGSGVVRPVAKRTISKWVAAGWLEARSIPIPRGLVPALAAHLAARETRARRGLQRGTWQDRGRVFPGRSGRNLHPVSLRHALRDATDAAHLPPVTTHELRHTCAGLLEHVGAPEHIIAGLLGHGPRVITRHYAPPTVDTMRPWVEAVYAAVWPPAAQRAAQ